MSAEELDKDTSKVTTDVQEIKKFLKKSSGDKVIYTTYQSLPKLIKANNQAKVQFDLALIDEAHKTTGRQGDLFTLIHDNENLPIQKRLYMTATPKIASDSADSDLIADMSNKDIYGPEFHRMSFGEAIELGILSDYHVIAVGVTEEELRSKASGVNKDSNKYQDLLNNVALEKVMQEHGAHHALSFHSRVDKAEGF
jgi:predicted helicase